MTKENVQNIIDKLASKRENPEYCECGCGNCCHNCWENPVLIGDVMMKIMEETGTSKELERIYELILLWRNCFYDKSLQQIAEPQCEEVDCEFKSTGFHSYEECDIKPEARKLFEFLNELLS